MRTIESRRFVAGKAELRLFLVEEQDSSLPFRLRLKHSERGEAKAGSGVLAGFPTETEALAALEVQTKKAILAGWTHVPAQVRLAPRDLTDVDRDVEAARVVKPCTCKPCRTCGSKHCCNLAVPHPGGWVRVLGEPRCPAPRERWSWR
jgi:hypothetical protein